MLPSATAITNTGSLGGQNIKMTFDENSLAFLQGVLTDLYSDPELAIIREYSTNARDSHIEAGQSRPIEITTPSTFVPNFVVQDFGIGLNADDITNIYSKYGASTKRETNEQAGMLGLGCKSALTYQNQFTVTGVKDGIESIVLVYRTEDGAAAMEVVSQQPSDKPNGVTISISAKPHNDLDKKVKQFFEFWPEGSVLVDGKAPERFNGIPVTDNMFLRLDINTVPKDILVMGGISYKITEKHILSPDNWSQCSAIIFADIGDVDFTPSREDLQDTAKTNSKINDFKLKFREALPAAIQREIERAESYSTAAKIHHEITSLRAIRNLVINNFTWRGHGLSTMVGRFPSFYDLLDNKFMVRDVSFPVTRPERNLIITGFDGTKLHTVARRKIRKFLEDAYPGSSFDRAFMCEKLEKHYAFEDVIKVSWDDIQKVVLPKTPRDTEPKKPTSYDGWRGNHKEYGVTNPTGNVAYACAEEISRIRTYVDMGELLKMLKIDFLIVARERSFNKIERELPGAMHVKGYVEKAVEDYKKRITSADITEMAIALRAEAWYAELPSEDILDPAVREFIKHAGKKSDYIDRINEYKNFYRAAQSFGIHFKEIDDELINPFDGYSLISRYYNRGAAPIDQIVCYMNSWYKTLQERNAI